MAKWYRIENKADKAEIWIYEQIGEDWWTGEGTTAKTFQKELSQIKASQIDLHINSPGGEVFDGITIYNLLKQHPANVTTYIDGLAASIASVIALAGNKVVMADNALFMIHKAWGMEAGNSDDMRKMADTLDKVDQSIVNTYTGKTGKTDADVLALMEAETWFTAQEAKDAGFIDEISEAMDLAACAGFIPVMQKAKFKHIPEAISGKSELTARELERILRDGGCSEKQAKVILSEGFKGSQRDVDNSTQRDVEQKPQPKRDRIADLLIRAEKMAPSRN